MFLFGYKLAFINTSDIEDIKFGVETILIFCNFFRKSLLILGPKKMLERYDGRYKSYCQIENRQGIKNFDDIINVAINNGCQDLGVGLVEKFHSTKTLIEKCYWKPVITATQMLDSMIKPRPTEQKQVILPMQFTMEQVIMLSVKQP